MITKAGKTIIAKMFGNQVDNAFSFLVLGVGPRPQFPQAEPIVEKENLGWSFPDSDNLDADAAGPLRFIRFESPNLSNKNELDFEVLRLPIRESSVVFENGQTKLCLNATAPTRNRYEFSEIGVFSADSNAFLASKPPAIMFSFTLSEAWTKTVKDENNQDVQKLVSINPVSPKSGVYFRKATDINWYEPDDNGVVANTNYSSVRLSEWGLVLSHNERVDNEEPLFSLENSLPEDEVRVAFAYRGFDAFAGYGDDNADPTWNIKMILVDTNGLSATLVFNKKHILQPAVEQSRWNDDWTDDNVLLPTSAPVTTTDGYAVVANQKINFSYSEPTQEQKDNGVSFNFGTLDKCSFVFEGAGDNQQICLDGLRFDTKNYNNPAYGLVSYSVVQNNLDEDGVPVADSKIDGVDYTTIGKPQLFVKKSGTETIIEYKILLNNYDVRDVEEEDG